MKSDAELIVAANLNYVGSYRKLVEHSPEGSIRESGGVFAFVTGLPISLFNGCVVVAPATRDELAGALAWVAARGLPHRAWIVEEIASTLGDVAIAHGLEHDPAPYPGMVLHPIPDPPKPPTWITVRPVTDEGLEEYVDACEETGLPRDLAERLFSPAFAADPDVQLFTASLEGRAVGTSVAVRTGNVAGIYAVGTAPTARRRGIGTAASWAAVGAGLAWGCDTVVLQSTEMGLSVYTAMGFRTVVSYATFRQPLKT